MTAASVVIEPTLAALCERVAHDITTRVRAAIAANGRFTWVLSGGSTPRPLFELVARDARFREAVDWTRVHFFWSDERHVAPDHPESNFRMAREAMLAPLAIADANIHRMRGELADADAAAREHEDELARFFRLPHPERAKRVEGPSFDLALLGMGADGHTASLFPGSPALAETQRRVVATWSEETKTHRITLTVPVLNAAAHVIVLVAGADKSASVARVLEGPERPQDLPSQLIRPASGALMWALDRAAASGLLSKPR